MNVRDGDAARTFGDEVGRKTLGENGVPDAAFLRGVEEVEEVNAGSSLTVHAVGEDGVLAQREEVTLAVHGGTAVEPGDDKNI